MCTKGFKFAGGQKVKHVSVSAVNSDLCTAVSSDLWCPCVSLTLHLSSCCGRQNHVDEVEMPVKVVLGHFRYNSFT